MTATERVYKTLDLPQEQRKIINKYIFLSWYGKCGILNIQLFNRNP